MVLVALLLTAACGQSGDPAPQTPPADAWLAFEGTWTAAGTRRTLHLGAAHRAAIFELTGSLLLTGAQRPAVGFKAQAIGFSDSRAGMQGRCVWTDERGDMVYSELRGEAVGSGNHIMGTFVGGTGRYAGVTGDYTFQWQYVVDAEDGAVSGRVVDLKGRARLGQACSRACRRARPMNTADRRKLGKQALSCALVIGIWFAPVPAGLTKEAWHLFAVFAGAIFSVIVNAFPLLTASLLAVGTVVLTGTVDPAKAFAGFANASVLLVIVAFLVANAVVKSGLGRRISLLVVSVCGRSTLGLGYSIFLTDALIAPAFPSNTARGGVLYPIILSLAQSAGSRPEDADKRRLGGYLMFCGMASLSVSSALWLTATSANPIGVSLAAQYGVKIDFGTWLLAASVPALATILLLPLILAWLFPPGVTAMPDAPARARQELHSMGPLSRDEWIVAVTFAVMVTGWVMADSLHLSLTAVAFAGLGVLLATNVLTLEDINLQGGTLVTFLWLAVLFALSGQLNELGFMGYVGGRLTAVLGGIAWPIAYVVLLVLYVLMHYMFVSQSAQVLALFAVFLDVAVRTGVPASLMAFALLFASSYFSTITPQGGSQNVIFVGSNYLTQGELYRLGLLTTGFCLLTFLVLGTPWLLFVAR